MVQKERWTKGFTGPVTAEGGIKDSEVVLEKRKGVTSRRREVGHRETPG